MKLNKFDIGVTVGAVAGMLSGCIPGRPDLANSLYLDCAATDNKGIATQSIEAPPGETVAVAGRNLRIESPGRVNTSSGASYRESDLVISGTGAYAKNEYAVKVKANGQNTRITARVDCENLKTAPSAEAKARNGFSTNRNSTKASPLAYNGFGRR